MSKRKTNTLVRIAKKASQTPAVAEAMICHLMVRCMSIDKTSDALDDHANDLFNALPQPDKVQLLAWCTADMNDAGVKFVDE